ncbi:MAG TPA: lactonase family protein [Fimbriiglobus sp.]|nr:lactonase family protein [Fimbriiglobus sp.]
MSLLTAPLLVAGLALTAGPPASGKYWVYLGTYTAKNGSKGIYRCELDLKTGKLTEPTVAAEVGNPSYLTLSPNGKFLYAVGETTGTKKDGGGVYAFAVEAATGKLTKLDESTSGGAGPCHAAIDPTGKRLLVANYNGGSWKLFRLTADGKFGQSAKFEQLSGSGPNKDRQAAPHAHCGAFDAAGKKFFVVDLGTDRVWWYEIDAEKGPNGSLSVIICPPIKMPAASGPRHIDFTPAGDVAFVCGELDCTVSVARFDKQLEMFRVVQSLPTLPSGKPTPRDSTAAIHIHPNGKFVYVSNRGHNSIAAFQWDRKKLTPIGHAAEGIKNPRDFDIDPTGRWMVVANQDGNDLVVFEIGADGLPKPTGTKVAVPRPVCVKFLAKP